MSSALARKYEYPSKFCRPLGFSVWRSLQFQCTIMTRVLRARLRPVASAPLLARRYSTHSAAGASGGGRFQRTGRWRPYLHNGGRLPRLLQLPRVLASLLELRWLGALCVRVASSLPALDAAASDDCLPLATTSRSTSRAPSSWISARHGCGSLLPARPSASRAARLRRPQFRYEAVLLHLGNRGRPARRRGPAKTASPSAPLSAEAEEVASIALAPARSSGSVAEGTLHAGSAGEAAPTPKNGK